MITRRSLLAGAPAIFSSARAASRPMNVLLFAVDDLNTHVGIYGHPMKTPNIDALARSGVRFNNAYCQYPLCNPSRTSFLTGFRPPRTRVTGNQTWFRETMPDVVTLPQYFRQNGYYTAVTGKVFHHGLGDDKGWVDGTTPMHKAGSQEQCAKGRERRSMGAFQGRKDAARLHHRRQGHRISGEPSQGSAVSDRLRIP